MVIHYMQCTDIEIWLLCMQLLLDLCKHLVINLDTKCCIIKTVTKHTEMILCILRIQVLTDCLLNQLDIHFIDWMLSVLHNNIQSTATLVIILKYMVILLCDNFIATLQIREADCVI